jgi:hypothetical protein
MKIDSWCTTVVRFNGNIFLISLTARLRPIVSVLTDPGVDADQVVLMACCERWGKVFQRDGKCC